SAEVSAYAFCLQEAPRSLAALSPDHPHGWGLAVHDGHDRWDLTRNPVCAREDARFSSAATRARGTILIAHIRKRTVGVTSVQNTHPFQRGGWVFAHNGTISDLDFLAKRSSIARLREVEGETDSERFFAFLLTAVDDAEGRPDAFGPALRRALDTALLRPGFGAANFLLSDGKSLFAFRSGRSLHLLDRRASAMPSSRGAQSARRPALLVASEAITDEPWQEIAEGALLCLEGGSTPRWTTVRASSAAREHD
ncbi:MAG: class II glutamine amidotransferase, partial [Minicystis sp.]